MKNQWIIQCVGTSEEDQAHLRLLLRSARKQVTEDWVWGADSEADLLMMDSRGEIDDAAILRAAQPGVATAQLIDAEEASPEGLFLRRPFHKDSFATLLAEAAAHIAEAEAPKPADPAPQAPAQPEGDTQPAPVKAADPSVDANATRWLLQYLPRRVLGGPAQITLPGVPTLLIDPETRMFWAKASLPELEPYSREALRFGDWQHLEGDALEAACEGAVARPFAQLIWMDSFLHSNGILSRRFDPEGTYRLTKRLELANDYPRALRISAQMERPRKLADIARASGADLAEVFDIVNAYEAIGFLEWTRAGAAPARKG